ncbi:MAG: glutathione S-transferase family protein [Thalassobaculaceae bacterium]|nr:glutathione S-transferase family protein [Thalassobaculaceae bacterium]
MRILGDLASGNCLKVKYTADHLGLSYTWSDIDIMKGESRTEAFLALNPMGQVPVVVLDDGRAIAQSNAILQYLAEGTALLPADAYGRAKVAEWLFWEQYSHEPYVSVCRFHMYYRGEPKETREAWRVTRGEAALDAMDSALSGAAFLVGDSLTIADIALLAYTRLATEGGFDLAARPSVTAWIDRCEKVLRLDPAGAA